MANTVSVPLINLDFGTLKNAIATFLSGQQYFKDYNFQGSSMSVLTDVLAWFSTQDAFYTNMLNTESHLDSAQLLGSVISEAKSLNYCPISPKAAQSNLLVTFNSSNSTYLLGKGSTFTTTINANAYNFSISDNILIGSSNGYFSTYIPILEGSYFSDSYIESYANNTLAFQLNNQNVDTSTITVVVYENGSTIGTNYTFATTLLGLNEVSKVYFLQMNYKGNYEITFGDGVVGYRPSDGALIIIDYLVTSGSDGNGGIKYTPNFSLQGASNVVITTIIGSYGGSNAQSIESIRYYAPRAFQVQERGVVPEDYVILLMQQFPEIEAATAFNGATQLPASYSQSAPQYGTVFIAVNINNVQGLPASLQTTYQNFLANKTMMNPVVVPAQFTYWSINSTIVYNINISTLTPQSIETLVQNTIISYNANTLNNFGVTLYEVPLLSDINDTDISIITNDTDIRIYKIIQPLTLTAQQLTVSFGIPLLQGYADSVQPHPDANTHCVGSDTFTYGADPVYIEDDGNGNLYYVKQLNTTTNVFSNAVYVQTVGTIDYANGILQFSSFYVNAFQGTGIKIYVKPASNDIKVPGDTILTITPEDINLTATAIRI